jgi:hypothetical protein
MIHRMICVHVGCYVEIVRESRAETDAALAEAGWRWWRDGKSPPMRDGAALCGAHKSEAKDYPLAAGKKGAKR